MANRVLIYPEHKMAEAEAYAAAADTAWREITGNPNLSWSYVRTDAFNQIVLPLLAAPQTWNDVEIEEPPACLAARADGVIHDSYVPAEVEDE